MILVSWLGIEVKMTLEPLTPNPSPKDKNKGVLGRGED
jgi:hypothetical protein